MQSSIIAVFWSRTSSTPIRPLCARRL